MAVDILRLTAVLGGRRCTYGTGHFPPPFQKTSGHLPPTSLPNPTSHMGADLKFVVTAEGFSFGLGHGWEWNSGLHACWANITAE